MADGSDNWRRVPLSLAGRARVVGAALMLATLGMAKSAAAFEREWHLGGGLGGAVASGYPLGAAANLYGAYGISDAFDVRAEFLGSLHQRPASLASFYGGKLALAYKIDVIQWIPWIGVAGGVLGATHVKAPFRAVQPSAGLIAGLDYAWNRNFGLGLCASADTTFRESAIYGAGFLRAEYRFGW